MARRLPISFLLLIATGIAQDTYSTFNDPNGRFQFRYPAWFQLFMGPKIGETALLSYMPICDKQAIACVIEPVSDFKNTNLEGASFQIETVTATSEDSCLKIEPSREEPTRIVNGIRFRHGTSEGAAAGHSSDVELYRAFLGGACFDARITITQTSLAIAPAGSHRIAKIEGERLQTRMNAILNSLHFLKP